MLGVWTCVRVYAGWGPISYGRTPWSWSDCCGLHGEILRRQVTAGWKLIWTWIQGPCTSHGPFLILWMYCPCQSSGPHLCKVEVGGRPGLPDPNRPYGLSGDVNNTELALDMPEGREMTEQTDWGGGGGGGAKQPSLEGRKWRWGTWDTTCWHKSKDSTPSIAWRRQAWKLEALDDLAWKDERGPL